MRRTGYLGIPLLLIALMTPAAPAFAQAAAAAQQKTPQFKTTQEYNGAMAVYNEKDPVKKAAAGETFIKEFSTSEYIPTAHILIIRAYVAGNNWAKVMEAADRAVANPGVDLIGDGHKALKETAFESGMIAAQNANNVDRVISYGEKLLGVNPNNLNAMITVSAAILTKLPTDPAAKTAALDKAEGLAKKALAGVEAMVASANAQTKGQLEQIQGNLHSTLGLVAYNRPDYPKSIQEYKLAIQKTPKDDLAHFYLALNYQALMVRASNEYKIAVDEENKAKKERAEQPVIDELAAKGAGLADDVRKQRDDAMDELAIAVKIAGPYAAQAKDALSKMWAAKNNDDMSGLQDFIDKAKVP
jgi:hypothetical protein